METTRSINFTGSSQCRVELLAIVIRVVLSTNINGYNDTEAPAMLVDIASVSEVVI